VPTEPDLQDVTDEQLHAELLRRVDQISEAPPSTTEPSNLSELPPGSWVQLTDDNPPGEGTITGEYEAIVRLAFARMRELLAIPLDPTDSNYAASLRGINTAVSTLLTFIGKAGNEMLRPPKDDNLPKIIVLIKEEEERRREEQERLWAAQMPKLARELIEVSDADLGELLTMRREHLNWRQRSSANLHGNASQSARKI
jgi:hypothetical protein